MRRLLFAILLGVTFSGVAFGQARLCVEILGARPFKGPVLIGVTTGPQKKLVQLHLLQVHGGSLKHCFDSLPTNEVELYVFQDENSNFKMDRAHGQVPAEPCALSSIKLQKGLQTTTLLLSRMIPQPHDLHFLKVIDDSIQESPYSPQPPKKNSRKRRKDG